MSSSGMLLLVAFVRTDVSEEHIASVTRVTIIGELRTKLAVPNNRSMLRRSTRFLITANVVPRSPIIVTLMMEAIHSSETSVLIRATRRYIPEDDILQMWTLICSCFDAVGVATGYGLYDRGIGVRVLAWARIFTSPYRQDRLCGSPNLPYGYRKLFPESKAAGT
jgi:hypothetical protein